jgi:glutamine synthetase
MPVGSTWYWQHGAIVQKTPGSESLSPMSANHTPGALLTALEMQVVKHLLPTYVVMHGVPISKVVPTSHYQRMLGGLALCTGGAMEGVLEDVSDEEFSARPDPQSCTILPWRPDTSWYASDLWCEGKPFEPCHGKFASFMTKPYADRAGSGAHLNIFLFDLKSKRNLIESRDDPRGCSLSGLGYHFIADVLKHRPAICAVVAPTDNSYKLLVPKGAMPGVTWASIFVSNGSNNRTNTVMIPLGGGRVELRFPDAVCHSYLGLAMTIAAGLEGVREQLDQLSPTWRTCTSRPSRSTAPSACRAFHRHLGRPLMRSRLIR